MNSLSVCLSENVLTLPSSLTGIFAGLVVVSDISFQFPVSPSRRPLPVSPWLLPVTSLIPLAAFIFFSLSLTLFSFNLLCLHDDSFLFVPLGVPRALNP